MPVISKFFGIVIAMFFDEHPPPHFHVRYQEHDAKITIETGEILKGYLPRTAARLVEEWRTMHVSELLANWEKLEKLHLPDKIKPLE